MRSLLIAFAMIFGSPALADMKPVALTKAELAQVRSVIIYTLVDPDSAKFRDISSVIVTRSNGTKIQRVCGFVNGRNQMGGYAGFEMFGGQMVNGQFKRMDFFGACN